MGNQLQLVKNQLNYVLGMDEFEINMTYLIWSCLRNTQDFSTYRAKFKSKFEGKILQRSRPNLQNLSDSSST